MKIRVVNEKWFPQKIPQKTNCDGNFVSNPFCCIGVLEAFVFHAIKFKVEYT